MIYEKIINELNDAVSVDTVNSAYCKTNIIIDNVLEMSREVISKELNQDCKSDMLISLLRKFDDLHNQKLKKSLSNIMGLNSARAEFTWNSAYYFEEILLEFKVFCEEIEKYYKK